MKAFRIILSALALGAVSSVGIAGTRPLRPTVITRPHHPAHVPPLIRINKLPNPTASPIPIHRK